MTDKAVQVMEMLAKLNVKTLDDLEAVVLARQTYSRLTEAEQKRVSNLQNLENAEAHLISIWIDNLKITSLLDGGAYGVVLRKFQALNERQKKLVPNADKFQILAEKMKPLQKEKELNFKKAMEVQAIIEEMQVLSLEDKGEATQARAAYDKLTADQKAVVTNYGLLKKAENQIARWEKKKRPHQAPENIVYAGARSSTYGIRDPWLAPADWQYVTDTMKDHFPHAQPTHLWIVGCLDKETGIGGVALEFEQPQDGVDYAKKNIRFAPPQAPGHLPHEEYLNYFDAQGIKVFLQVEPGFADVKLLMDLVLAKYGHHPCVVGFGVDVEWYYGIKDDAGIPLTDKRAEEWNQHLKAINPAYRLFVKHYNINWLPPTYRSDLVFVQDSQGFGSLNGDAVGVYGGTLGFVPENKMYLDHFYPNEVIFQIGYFPDLIIFYPLPDPVIQNIGHRLAEIARQKIGIAWVDFMLKDPVSFPKLLKNPAEEGAIVNWLLRTLGANRWALVGKRFAEGTAKLMDALYIARLRRLVQNLGPEARSALHQAGLEKLEKLEPKALSLRIAALTARKVRAKDKPTVAAIEDDYKALNPEQKAQVDNYEQLLMIAKDLGPEKSGK